MAMARLAAANADLFLSGHLHISHVSHAVDRYEVGGHSALIVQAGTVSTRSRGEQPSFNVLRMQRPEIELSRHSWDDVGGAASRRRPSAATGTRVAVGVASVPGTNRQRWCLAPITS